MNPILKNVVRNAGALVSQGLSLIPGEVPRSVVLELKGAYPVARPQGPLPVPIPLPGQPRVETLPEFTRKLELLGRVANLAHVVILERGFDGGLGTAYGVRRALEDLRASGKRVTFYADSVNNATLYLGSVADEFAVLPEGGSSAVGLASRVVFLGETMKKLGINLEYERRSEYKAAPERFTGTGFSEPFRESITALLESVNDHWLETIAQGRNLELDALKSAVDAAPMMADEALSRA